MKNKIALVTGAAKGIGACIVEKMCQNGYDVIIHYNNSQLLAEELKDRMNKSYNSSVYLVKADLNNEDDITRMIYFIKSITNKLDVLVNNAALSLDCDIDEKTKKDFMNILSVNLVAPFLLVKELSNLLKDGIVVNMASTDGIDTYSVYNVDYSTSKAGLILLTKILSERYLDIYFVAIAPNWVKTESVMAMEPGYLENELNRVKQKRILLPFEVANKVMNIINKKNLESGSLIRIDGEDNE